jgi:hypothetical protein
MTNRISFGRSMITHPLILPHLNEMKFGFYMFLGDGKNVSLKIWIACR